MAKPDQIELPFPEAPDLPDLPPRRREDSDGLGVLPNGSLNIVTNPNDPTPLLGTEPDEEMD